MCPLTIRQTILVAQASNQKPAIHICYSASAQTCTESTSPRGLEPNRKMSSLPKSEFQLICILESIRPQTRNSTFTNGITPDLKSQTSRSTILNNTECYTSRRRRDSLAPSLPVRKSDRRCLTLLSRRASGVTLRSTFSIREACSKPERRPSVAAARLSVAAPYPIEISSLYRPLRSPIYEGAPNARQIS